MIANKASGEKWKLRDSELVDLDPLMSWFPTRQDVEVWGGPEFRFPFTLASFREDIRWDHLDSFSLEGRDGRLAAFGQIYRRKGRTHLARLVVCPELRSRGVGKCLIEMLMSEGRRRHGSKEFSLFVFRENIPALRCYESMGFIVCDYPPDMPHGDVCYFLVWRDGDNR